MAKIIGKINNFTGGISDSPKLGPPATFAFARAMNFRSDPAKLTVNPRAERQAAGIISDLPMWADLACSNLYFYGNTGKIYQKDLNDTWTLEHTAPASQGNGLVFFSEDSYLYYAQDKTIGRRSDACGTGTYYDGFLETEGGEPTNSYSITFASASSQYASIADNASLSITGDISLETYIKFTSLPTAGGVQTLISKWNQSGNQRSYKFDVTTSSNSFGDGRDGSKTVSSNTTDDPVDANCSGTVNTYTLTITNAHASFASIASGDKVLIIQSRGTGCGTYQIADVQGYSAGTLTLQQPLTFSPTHSATTTDANKAQVLVAKQYTTVSVSGGVTWTGKAWDGLKGGILYFFANTSFTNAGTVYLVGKGYSQNGAHNPSVVGNVAYAGGQGEGTLGFGLGPPTGGDSLSNADLASRSKVANGNGGGAGTNFQETGSGGGGHATIGQDGNNGGAGPTTIGYGGTAVGDNLLAGLFFGGQGGGTGMGGGFDRTTYNGSTGGNGGGIFGFWATAFVNTGTINLNGADGVQGNAPDCPGAGGGGGGSCQGHFQTGTIGTITAIGGTGSAGTSPKNRQGGNGAVGRVAFYYSTSYTGDSTPGATFVQNTTLANTAGYILRFIVSSNGTNSETYSVDITDIIDTTNWNRYQVTWSASTSTANFYVNANLLKTQIGSLTSIFNSTARFALATSYDDSGNPQDFLNAKMDDTRVWNAVRNSGNLLIYNDQVLTGVDTNLSAYYKFEQNVNDSQTYTAASNLTATNGPTYSTDVPFAGITTRADQDVSCITAGQTYTLGTTLSEAAADRKTFQPTKEPLKSIQLKIDTVGTGNWTVVIHDGLNREIESMTVSNAMLHTGIYEFIFAESARPILTANYHVHVYSTVGDGKIVTSALNNMEGTTITSTTTGAWLATFYQILVDDMYHPMTQFENFIAIGNERYVAKLEAGNIYNPHQLVLPSGYRVRCFAKWNEFLAIGVWKGSSITDTDQGKVFLWDGSSDISNTSSANTIIDCLQGGVNSMQGAGGVLSVIAGYKGRFMNYGGVSQSSYYSGGQLQKVTQLPLLGQPEYAEIAPGAMCMWQSVMHFGATLNTDSSTVHQGVYSYGTLNANYPVSLGFDYPLSLGDQTTSSTRIGVIFPQGEDLYIGWQNANAYGIDRVAVTNQVYDTATMELLITDLGILYQQKPNLVFRVDFEPLVSGQTVTIKYKADRSSNWSTINTQSTVGATSCYAPIDIRSKEIQLATDVTTGGNQLTIIGMTFEGDNASEALGISG